MPSDKVPNGKSVERRLCDDLSAFFRIFRPNGPSFCQNQPDLLANSTREPIPCVKMGRNVACNVYRVVPKDFLLLFTNRFHPSAIQLAICCISKGLNGAMPCNANE